MSLRRVGVLSIGSILVGYSKALSAAQVLAGLLDTVLKSPFGLNVAAGQLSGQLAGLLGAQVSLSNILTNPGLYLAQLKAGLLSSLATLPGTVAAVQRDLGSLVSVNLATAAGVRANLAGIKGLIDLVGLSRLAQLGVIADLRARLSSGGVVYWVGSDASLATLAGQLAAEPTPPGFSATESTFVVVLAAQEPAAIESLKVLFFLPP